MQRHYRVATLWYYDVRVNKSSWFVPNCNDLWLFTKVPILFTRISPMDYGCPIFPMMFPIGSQVNNNDLHMLLMLFYFTSFFPNYTLYADSHTLMLINSFMFPKCLVISSILIWNWPFPKKIPILLDIVIGQWCSFHVPKVPILFLVICTSFPMVSWKFPNPNSIVLKRSLIDNSPKLCMFPNSIPKCPNFSY